MRLNINGSMFLYKKTKKQIEGNKFRRSFVAQTIPVNEEY